jgi:hypothetical protein
MKTTRKFIAAVGVLLFVQQVSQGQLQPGYSSYPQSGGFTQSDQSMMHPDWLAERPHRAFGSDQINWANPQATSTTFGGEVQPATWCDAEDGSCSHDDPRCSQFWEHRTRYFGDFLYLTARDSGLPYATHVDGPVPNAAPLAPSSVLEPDFESGFRVGGAFALDPWSSITATFWFFQSETTGSIELPGNIGWVRSEVTHPSTASVANDSLFARARDEISFKMGDVAFKGCDQTGAWVSGVFR